MVTWDMRFDSLTMGGHRYFYRLLLSFGIIVLFLTLFMGTVSTRYFTLTFRNELISVNQKMLYHLEKIIDTSVLQRVQMNYDALAIGSKDNYELLELFSLPLEGNFPHVKGIYDFLQQQAGSQADLIDSIHVYYKDNNIVISSRNGLVYPRENRFHMDIEWLDQYRMRNETRFWLPVRTIDAIEQIPILSLVKPFPATVARGEEKGVVCINFKLSALEEILREHTQTGESLLLVDENNSYIIGGDMVNAGNQTSGFMDISLGQVSSGNNIQEWMGVPTLISHVTMETNGWKIVSITPMSLFMEGLNDLKRNIRVISLAAIMVGLIITVIFSSRIYSPLRLLIDKVKGGMRGEADDEYSLISNALDNLTQKVNSLEHTLDENKPLIKHNIVSGLIRHTIRSPRELDHRLSLINRVFDKPWFSAQLLLLPSGNIEDSQERRLKERQRALLNLMKIFESFTSREVQFLATEIAENEIALIQNSINGDPEHNESVVRTILESIFADSDKQPVVLIGNGVNSPLAIHNSFAEAMVMRKYTFFLPGEHFFMARDIIPRETSIIQFPDSLTDQFSKGLNLRKIEMITNVLDQTVHALKEESYSFAYGHRKILELVTLFSDYLKDLDIVPESLGGETLHSRFRRLPHIDSFRSWFISLVKEVYTILEERSQNKNYRLIEKARRYIEENIESDLYLDLVAEQIKLKPQYLSKLFREYTGKPFVSYVNEHKMERASQLLTKGGESVASLAQRLSFSSSAYFIKKFKARYGMTPVEYREKRG